MTHASTPSEIVTGKPRYGKHTLAYGRDEAGHYYRKNAGGTWVRLSPITHKAALNAARQAFTKKGGVA